MLFVMDVDEFGRVNEVCRFCGHDPVACWCAEDYELEQMAESVDDTDYPIENMGVWE